MTLGASILPPPDPGFAPAKVNLALHVTGRRADGYHILDSLVVFADIGDRVEARPAAALGLTLEGPFSDAVPKEDNLVLHAARALRAARGVGRGAALTLAKGLPSASGIGGGSADAAAAIRVLSTLWGVPQLEAEEALALGADVPACLLGRPARMRGVGERLDLAPPLPPMALVLANPGTPVATPAVFAALDRADGEPMGAVPEGLAYDAFVGWLADRANHLEGAAAAVEPVIARVMTLLRTAPELDLVRMSGSGATCFGLCRDLAAAERAADRILAAEPDWWVRAAAVLS